MTRMFKKKQCTKVIEVKWLKLDTGFEITLGVPTVRRLWDHLASQLTRTVEIKKAHYEGLEVCQTMLCLLRRSL